MFVSENITVNEKGHLAIGGVDAVDLAEDFKTPLYVMDEVMIRQNCRAFKSSIDKYYDGKGLVCYASKAFCCLEMCKIMKQEGIGLDVVSAGELFTAVKAGCDMADICFHGNNKTADELEYAVEQRVGRIVVDNVYELEMLDDISGNKNSVTGIMLRIKPGIDAHTHDFVRTGQIDSKFGFALETGEAFDAVKKAISCKNLKLKGLHCHIGSQIFDIEPFELAAEVMLEFISKIKTKLAYEIDELNLGGGFGIKYLNSQNPSPFELYMEKVSARVKEKCSQYNIKQPFIIIEPGRAIAAPAGVTLYTVGGIKEIPNVRTYVSIDGGMGDNPRYALYQSEYEITNATKANLPKDNTITLAGKCCESGDLIGENLKVQEVAVGDTIAVFATGAYNYSMSSNYNRIPKPAVVFLNNKRAYLAVKRETLDDIIRNDVDI